MQIIDIVFIRRTYDRVMRELYIYRENQEFSLGAGYDCNVRGISEAERF